MARVFKLQDPIDSIRIAAPCPATWEKMAGDDRIRHCTSCDLNVYNFAAMTRDEVRELLIRTEGRVCARLYRRADGTLLTSDCPTGRRALRRRLSRRASAMMAALLSVATLASGCASPSRFQRNRSKVQLEIERAATPQPAVFAGVVLDDTGQPLPGVTVVVRDEALQRDITTFTDRNGTFTIQSLQEGTYRVEVSLLGFRPAVVQRLSLKQSDVARAHVALRLDTMAITITVGAIAVEPPAGVSTTFTQDLINKLPL